MSAAIRLANIAGGLEVEKIGVATVSREEILHDLLYAPTLDATVPRAAKIKSLPQLTSELELRRAQRAEDRVHQRLLRCAPCRTRAISRRGAGPRPTC